MPDYHFGPDYRERWTLPSGEQIMLRCVSPKDKALLAEGLAKLSPQARYARFLGHKNKLSDRELAYLTEVDGVNHFALGALRRGDDGAREGIAVARFVRQPDDPVVAEPAVTVIDAYQGQGVGCLMLRRLTQAARERGYQRFRCNFWAGNDKIRNLLDDYAPWTITADDGETITMEFALPEPSFGERLRDTIRRTDLYRAFTNAAEGALRMAVTMLDDDDD